MREAGTARVVVVALAGLLAAVGCRGDDKSEAVPSATVPAAPATTTTTNPYAIPEVIDAAYVNRVLAGLDAALGETYRLVMRTQDVPPEVIDRVKAVFLDREGQNVELMGLQHDLRNGFREYQANPGNKVSTVTELLVATSDCIFVKVERDYSRVGLRQSPHPSTEWIVLRPRDPAQGPNSYNPTPWAFATVGVAPPAQAC